MHEPAYSFKWRHSGQFWIWKLSTFSCGFERFVCNQPGQSLASPFWKLFGLYEHQGFINNCSQFSSKPLLFAFYCVLSALSICFPSFWLVHGPPNIQQDNHTGPLPWDLCCGIPGWSPVNGLVLPKPVQDSCAFVVDGLVTPWDQFNLIYAFHPLQFLPCLLCRIKLEDVPVIIVALNGPRRTW